MRTVIHRLILSLAALLSAGPALAEDAEDAAAVRAVIADWYARVREPNPNAPWSLMAPAVVNAGPGYSVPADLHSGSAAIRGPYLNHELSARAMQFSYEIDLLKLDPRFARAMVWERGYFSASAAQKTYENAASTLFVLEKPDNGSWKILLHDANAIGIPLHKITDPTPDLRDLCYSRCGPACDPVVDAKKASQWWPPDGDAKTLSIAALSPLCAILNDACETALLRTPRRRAAVG